MLNRIIIAIAIIGSLFLIFRIIRIAQLYSIKRSAKSAVTEKSVRHGIQLLYFSSATCSKCLMQEKILTKIFEDTMLQDIRFKDITLNKYTIEKNTEFSRQWKIFTLPTIILLSNNGNVEHINNGLTSISTLRSQMTSLFIRIQNI